MSKFKEGKGKAMPAISTASLPDIIFMLLFFFMVVTQLRDNSLKINVITPKATELTKLVKKSLVNTIFIGRPKDKYQNQYGTAPRLQLDDQISDPSKIPLFLEKFKETVDESSRRLITTSLKVDSDATMGILQDVKTALRKADQLKINYSAKQREDF